MLNPSFNELKLIAKNRGIKGYKNNYKDELTKVSTEPEPKIIIEKIRKEFNELRDRFSKSKMKEIRRNCYEIENKNNLSTPEIKEIEKIILYKKLLYLWSYKIQRYCRWCWKNIWYIKLWSWVQLHW